MTSLPFGVIVISLIALIECVNIANFDETRPQPDEEVIVGLNAPHPGRHNYGREVRLTTSPEGLN